MNEIIFDCHITSDENDLSEITGKIKKINGILADEFNIKHTTIQFEQSDVKNCRDCNI